MSGFRLRSCVWELTLACCFGCRYCGSAGGRARADELSTAECLDTADQLAELGCRRVSLIGGEVFLRRDWAQIAGRLTGRGAAVAVITNGYLMSPEVLAQLREAGVESVAVSIDGPEDVHDAGRQAGSFRRAMDAVGALVKAGIPASVISTLRRDCVGRLEELYRVLEGSGIAAWQLQACSPMGNAARGLDWRMDPAEVIRFVERHRDRAPFMLGAADNVGYFTEEEPGLRGADGACFQGCRAGISAIGIDSVGNIRGCESIYDERFIEGNLRQRRLRDIWEDPKKIRSVRFQVGLVFQYPEYQLFEETVYKDIAFGPANMGKTGDELDRCVREAAKLVGIRDDQLDKSPFELSGGQKRRVALAGVIAMEPKVLILDEPSAGLDPAGRENLLANIRDIHRNRGTTILMVSHSMDEVAQNVDRILVLKSAHVLMSGTPKEVFARADELLSAGLDVPQVTRVAMRLRQQGLPIDPAVYTVQDLEKELLAVRKGGAAC